MKLQLILAVAVACCVSACGERPSPQPVEPPQTAEPAGKTEPAAEQAQITVAVDDEFINHMHAHAEQMDDLMFALSDGDLEGAMTPAYWLSGHKTVDGVPEEWQQYVTGMREAARAVESAENIDAARAAAEDISRHCQGCHTAAGVIAAD
jgi:hypothetical protein